MLTVHIEPLVHHYLRETPKLHLRSKLWSPYSLCSPKKFVSHSRNLFCDFKHPRALVVRANSNAAAIVETFQSTDLFFKETFHLEQKLMVKGKVSIRLDHGKDEQHWQLTVGCNLPGKWILHWGVSYMDDVGAEWDQPPSGMRPPDSVRIKDYAIETPLKKSPSSFGDNSFQEVKIEIDLKSAIAAIHFVLKDEETGAWYQHRGRDFKVPLITSQADGNVIGAKRNFDLWPGSLGQLSSTFVKSEDSNSKHQDEISESKENEQENGSVEGFYEELPISKEDIIKNSITVSVKKSHETAQSLIYMETDLSGDVVVHWGVCRDDSKRWEIPSTPYPLNTVVFKDKALRTLLQDCSESRVVSHSCYQIH